MVSVQDIEVLFNRSTELKTLLDNIPISFSSDVLKWHSDLEGVSSTLENLIVSFTTDSYEHRYYELSEVYLTTKKIVSFAHLPKNNNLDEFFGRVVEFHDSIYDALCEVDILAHREIYERQLSNFSLQKTLETKFTELQGLESEIQKRIDTRLKLFEDQFQNASAEIAETSKSNRDKIAKQIKEIQRQVTDELSQWESESLNRIIVSGQGVDKRLEIGLRQLTQLESSLNTAVERELTNFKEAANELQALSLEAIRSASSDASNSIQKQLSTTINSFESYYNKQIGTINSRIDDEVREFESKKIEITEVLGEISTAYQAGANTTQADKEQAFADSYRKYGIIGLVATIFCSIWLFNDYIHFFGKPNGPITPINDLGFGWFALRFMTITLLTAPSIYMLKESAYHRSKENLYRQRGTQLASIGAYLGELDPTERAAMKKELAANFFSFYDGKTDTSNVPDFIKNMNEAIKLAHAIKTPPTSSPEKKEQAT